MASRQTAIVTGGAGGLGAGLVEGFLGEGYSVVATSRDANRKLAGTSDSLIVLDGDIGRQQTATQAVEAAIDNFGTIDVLVNNAGTFLNKSFTDFTIEDFDALISANLLGFFYITQLTVRGTVRLFEPRSGRVQSRRQMVHKLNIDGDGRADQAGHGGEQRAVIVRQMGSYPVLRALLSPDPSQSFV